MTPALHDAFIDNPENLLALTFSAPYRRSEPDQSVTIDFTDVEVRASVQRPRLETRAPRLLASKETIFSAILLNQLIDERGPDFAESLVERAVRFARSAAKRPPEFQPFAGMSEEQRNRPPAIDTSSFFSELESGPRNIEIAMRKTGSALTFLEREGLAVDPAFTPDLMVLVGLIPVHFSVRTPKGQRIYKEICLNAPLWSLKVSRGSANDRAFTDVDFHFRGIQIVKKAIIAMATQYLDSEEDGRRRNGQPVLRRERGPELDAD